MNSTTDSRNAKKDMFYFSCFVDLCILIFISKCVLFELKNVTDNVFVW